MVSEKKQRLDVLLVERGLAPSREAAQRVIRAGQVWRATEALDKPGVRIEADAEIDVRSLGDRFVSRGGLKLQGALDACSEAGIVKIKFAALKEKGR